MNKLITIVFFLGYYIANAQTTFQFTSGLAAGPCHRYGRQAIVQDQLAYRIYSGNNQKPEKGKTVFVDEEGNAVQWQPVNADSTGRFRGEPLSNGYLYLRYDSDRDRFATLNVTGNSMFYFNGEPHGGDIYRDGWMYVPVQLKKGSNDILVRCSGAVRWQGIQARMLFPEKAVQLLPDDLTLPHVVIGESASPMWGAVVLSNGSNKTLTDLTISATIEGKPITTKIPAISPMTIRKVGFRFDPGNASEVKQYACALVVRQKQKQLDEKTISIEAVNRSSHHSCTFQSSIDGSVQYFSVAPQSGNPGKGQSLFLSVHGAGVEAIGQARAYALKDWGVLVAPTNRRPRGFNWEDWGRLDALEVLDIAREKFLPDPDKIYLTGHSMGGHGTWFLGATYPDKWAAIAPCAGYPSLADYGSADGRIPLESKSEIEKILLRASSPSDVIALASNYKPLGIYIHHGDSDKVVSVNYARQMRKVLSEFHPDFSYYEYPGGSHWFGAESVDWPPLFDYFKWHKNQVDSAVNVVDFTTANPAVSSQFRWVSVLQQKEALKRSRVQLNRHKKLNTITGTTENISALKIRLSAFSGVDKVEINLDGDKIVYNPKTSEEVYLYKKEHWEIGNPLSKKMKGPHRGSTLKLAFNHRMIFVYATKGNAEENKWAYNKARYDAEVWYYRGNGSVDIMPDKDFDPKKYPDRGIILYGNATTNSAYTQLLDDCPILLKRGMLTMGDKSFTGNDIAAFFVWPRQDSDNASVAVIGGTGVPGMMVTEANQYFAGGSGFPDYMIFSPVMLKDGVKGVKAAGFYGNDWTLENGEHVFQTEE